LLYFGFASIDIKIIVSGFPHHGKHIARIAGRVRIVFGIRMRMMQPMQYTIGIGTYVRGALRQVTAYVKSFFPASAHSKQGMCCITVVKNGLKKK
jgi:hypothetical protein